MAEVHFTEKQKELIKMLRRDEFKRINILYGSVRSGKTWITLLLFAFWILQMPEDAEYLMCAKTLTSLKRNCLELLQKQVGDDNFSYSISAKEGQLFGRKIYLEGANDARSESKIRGMTLQGAYIDEITLIERDFFAMLLSRLSERGAKLFGSTNPDNQQHWLKTEYLDRGDKISLFQQKFILEDNTFLDPVYVSSLKQEYTGVFYDRFILGEWVNADGIIYDMFDTDIHVLQKEPETEGEYYVSSDYGIQNATVFLLWRKIKDSNQWVCLREYYYSGRNEKKQKTVSQLVADMTAWLDGIRPKQVIIDPSAAALIVEMRKAGYKVHKAKNEVLDGIADVSTMLHAKRLLFMSCCKNTIDEFGVYAWDPKAAARGEDKPIKEHDHAQDSIRYFVRTLGLVKRDKATSRDDNSNLYLL